MTDSVGEVAGDDACGTVGGGIGDRWPGALRVVHGWYVGQIMSGGWVSSSLCGVDGILYRWP